MPLGMVAISASTATNPPGVASTSTAASPPAVANTSTGVCRESFEDLSLDMLKSEKKPEIGDKKQMVAMNRDKYRKAITEFEVIQEAPKPKTNGNLTAEHVEKIAAGRRAAREEKEKCEHEIKFATRSLVGVLYKKGHEFSTEWITLWHIEAFMKWKLDSPDHECVKIGLRGGCYWWPNWELSTAGDHAGATIQFIRYLDTGRSFKSLTPYFIRGEQTIGLAVAKTTDGIGICLQPMYIAVPDGNGGSNLGVCPTALVQ
ncbi:uncharacterized protein LOC126260542 [Schistocerca nitens]|uniref:uncharacterized protein LOC126260542 n=1 Tax=Schistocerca nitens TaxID=7011 RepID=UPI0021190095|nr:uncharacterized protein LOC126260542 [Schistocerca nitens]